MRELPNGRDFRDKNDTETVITGIKSEWPRSIPLGRVEASSGQSRREPGGAGLQPAPNLPQLAPNPCQELIGLSRRVDAIPSAKRHQVEALDDLGHGADLPPRRARLPDSDRHH
jgi:hypothetical protein